MPYKLVLQIHTVQCNKSMLNMKKWDDDVSRPAYVRFCTNDLFHVFVIAFPGTITFLKRECKEDWKK
jgi:hypothetical protein